MGGRRRFYLADGCLLAGGGLSRRGINDVQVLVSHDAVTGEQAEEVRSMPGRQRAVGLASRPMAGSS